jgi:hypothetical protein
MVSFAELNLELYGLHLPRIGGATDAFRNVVSSHTIDVRVDGNHLLQNSVI